MKKNLRYTIGIIGILTIISILLGLFMPMLQSFRIVFGSVYVLFLPGFIISYLFFKRGKIDVLERIALSFALSIAIVPLVVFYLNLIGIKIKLLNTFLIILAIITISLFILKYKRKSKDQKREYLQVEY